MSEGSGSTVLHVVSGTWEFLPGDPWQAPSSPRVFPLFWFTGGAVCFPGGAGALTLAFEADKAPRRLGAAPSLPALCPQLCQTLFFSLPNSIFGCPPMTTYSFHSSSQCLSCLVVHSLLDTQGDGAEGKCQLRAGQSGPPPGSPLTVQSV